MHRIVLCALLLALTTQVQAHFVHSLVINDDLILLTRYLQEHPENINQPAANDGKTPLIWAAWQGKTEIVEFLLQQPNLELEAQDAHGYTALALACTQKDNQDVVDMLLAKNASVNTINKDGNSPLYFALKYAPELLPLLLDNSANYNIVTKEGSLLTLAAAKFPEAHQLFIAKRNALHEQHPLCVECQKNAQKCSHVVPLSLEAILASLAYQYSIGFDATQPIAQKLIGLHRQTFGEIPLNEYSQVIEWYQSEQSSDLFKNYEVNSVELANYFAAAAQHYIAVMQAQER